jgi:hypothetical protein
MPLILLKPFVFTRISAQTQCTIRKSASDPSSNYSSFCRTAHARCGMRITYRRRLTVAQSWKPTENFTEPL